MERNVFEEILRNLKGINYFFIGGLSVAIHSEGKRIPGDVDIVVHDNDINRFAKLMGTKAKHRKIDKETFKVEDYGFVAHFKGQEVEVTTGYPKKRMYEKTFNKLFEKKIKKTYEGLTVVVEPIEELLTQKAYMHREKDIEDLEILKGIKFDKKLLVQLAKDKGNAEEIVDLLKKVGYDL